MVILGIETSCDETSVSIIEATDNNIILKSNIIASSLPLHAQTGGIIPEIAARQQLKYMIPVINTTFNKAFKKDVVKFEYRNSKFETLQEDYSLRGGANTNDKNINIQNVSNIKNLNFGISSDFGFGISDLQRIDVIAVTYGPGLIGSLLVGVETAKTLAFVLKKPIVPVNHMIGHIYANWIDNVTARSETTKQSGTGEEKSTGLPRSPLVARNDIIFPALALVVSGGHTDLLLMKKHGDLKLLGGTRDDAAGEAFDKIGRLLGLAYPAGSEIEKLAKKGNPKRFRFPRPLIGSDDYDFSFSGLKTAVLREVTSIRHPERFTRSGRVEGSYSDNNKNPLNNQTISDLARGTQDAIIDVLVKKTLKAAQEFKVKSILLSGGVAANQALRDRFNNELRTHNSGLITKFFAPAKNLCTDNAAMIAAAAYFNYKPVPWQKITADPELYFE